MPYAIKYRSNFTNAEGNIVITTIYDEASIDPGLPEDADPIELTGAGLVISTVDNDEDKFTPIIAKRATFSFYSTSTINLKTFGVGYDQRFRMDIDIFDGVSTQYNVFDGFLVMDGHRQAFLPSEQATVITLTATDNLATGQNTPMLNSTGDNPKGYYKIIEFMVMCFDQILLLPIVVINNIKSEHDTSSVWYNTIYLDAKTFEKEINSCVSAYEGLEIILGNQNRLFQWRGNYVVLRVDELRTGNLFRNNFTQTGALSTTANEGFTKFIGLNQSIKIIDRSGEVGLVRPFKSSRLNFRYEYPKEMLCNMNFERGDLLSPLVVSPDDYVQQHSTTGGFPAVGDPLVTYKATGTGTYYKWTGSAYVALTGNEIPSASGYEAECWTVKRSFSNHSVPGTPTATTYIKRIFQNGLEIGRFLVITPPPTPPSPWDYAESEGMPVGILDKITFSVEFRIESNSTGSAYSGDVKIAHLTLETETGTIYTLDNDGKWWQTPQYRYLSKGWQLDQVDETHWQSLSITVDPIPASGTLYVGLYAGNQNAGSPMFNEDMYFQNLQVTYQPFINNSYNDVSGQYNKINSATDYKPSREGDVKISDSPRKIFKGTPFKDVAGDKFIAGRFYDASIHTSGLPAAEHLHPLGWLQAYDVWLQHNRGFETFDAQMRGLGLDLPDLIHSYEFTDPSTLTSYKKWMLLHYQMDLYTCIWSGRFAEIHDTSLTREYDGTHEFKYIENR